MLHIIPSTEFKSRPRCSAKLFFFYDSTANRRTDSHHNPRVTAHTQSPDKFTYQSVQLRVVGEQGPLLLLQHLYEGLAEKHCKDKVGICKCSCSELSSVARYT